MRHPLKKPDMAKVPYPAYGIVPFVGLISESAIRQKSYASCVMTAGMVSSLRNVRISQPL